MRVVVILGTPLTFCAINGEKIIFARVKHIAVFVMPKQHIEENGYKYLQLLAPNG